MKIDPTNLTYCCLQRLEKVTSEAPENTRVNCSCGNIISYQAGRWRWAGARIIISKEKGDT